MHFLLAYFLNLGKHPLIKNRSCEIIHHPDWFKVLVLYLEFRFYGIEVDLLSSSHDDQLYEATKDHLRESSMGKLITISSSNFPTPRFSRTKTPRKRIPLFTAMAKDPIRVLVTGAAGQIGYALVPMIARGAMLGPDQPVIIHMLDIEPAAEALEGVKMELIDAAFPLLKGVVATTDVVEACRDVNIAVMVGGFPRKEGMERKDVMSRNVSIYRAQASALEQHAAADCKVVVVANPANTNALIFKEFAPSIPEKNITCLTRLDHNRALGQISERLNVHVSDVKNVIIWGNHSSTQYPDVNHATVNTGIGEKPVRELVADDHWLNTEFISTVQQRGAAIIKARKLSSALSAASSACDHIHDWITGTPKGTWVSMGVYSDGSYGIQPGLMYSFPVTCEKGEWSIVQGLKIDEFSRAKMDVTAKELVEEKTLAYSCLN